ncbi:MAG: hypothetical protein C0475_01880 [Planctomyces sp.]|nr:hypothetical protein [Planctomyces sp.]MBA4039245.1 hypothetical protein [Planctomyces sp.]MBA4119601.1 hypothetical protein [Isosphaera sp.]
MLVLFDIDGTLLRTAGAGVRAMNQTARAVVAPHASLDGVDTAGRLDPLIVMDVHRNAGVPFTDQAHRAFRAEYARRMPEHLAASVEARAMPGVTELVTELAAIGGVTLGLLTGNYQETGLMKLGRVGIDPEPFVVNAWGDDSGSDPPTRDDLPRAAMERYAQARGRPIPAEDVLIIGDTPHDVRCARVNGCRVLAVATGSFSVIQLATAGADAAVSSLADTPATLRWIIDRRAR